MLATSVSETMEPFLVDQVDYVLLVSFTPSDSYSFSSPLLWNPKISEEKDLMETSILDSVTAQCWVSVPLLSASAILLSDDDWTRHCYISIAEYH